MNNLQSQGKASAGVQLVGTYRWLGGLLTAALLLGTISSATAHSSTQLTKDVKGQNNGAQTTHFTAAYFNGLGGFFTAAGERIVKTGPKAFTKDSETILISDISTWPAGTYTLIPTYITGFGWVGVYHLPNFPSFIGFFWFSDFDGQLAVSGTIVVTDNGDGTGTMNLDLYY
jgi:hypothetical protein